MRLNDFQNILFAVMAMVVIFSIGLSDSFEKTFLMFVVYAVSRFYFKFDEFVDNYKNRED